ncbi:c6 zinc finger domain [Trichoderma arundinaceum]|uniref:C6 zinc finger domain n=1 Tax=Trichoderma arundinaceum TaxID=490622 RepID=A0A395NC61_TRIAR|nr:c6 zinc finger domain [Trichoderma arundinaceum]
MATSAAPKSTRGRRAKACDSCSRRKIQCDAEVPQCNWCRHHDLACTYHRLVAKAKKKKSPDQKILQPESIARMETILAQRLSQSDVDSQLQYSVSSESDLRNATSFTGIPLFSDRGQAWIESRTGSCMTPRTLCSFGRQWHNPRRLYMDSDAAASPQPCELPPRSTVERYATIYSSSFECLVFPILTMISILRFEHDSVSTMASEAYAAAAASFIPQVTQEMTGDGLQALVTLAIVHYFMGDLRSTGLFISIATRLIFALNAHSYPEVAIPPSSSSSQLPSPPHSQMYDKREVACHLRDLFWTCYSLDKDLCIRTGQPSCLSDLHCDLTLPPNYSTMQNLHIQSRTIPNIASQIVPMYPWDLLLSQLKSRAYDALYSPMAYRKTQSELLESIRVLDESLEQWRLSLPLDFRPTLTFGEMTPVSADRLYIERVGDAELNHKATNMRAIIIYYPITALLALFSNILSNPLDETAPADVEILKSAPDLFKSIPIRKLTLAELTHLKLLDSFTMELARLGGLAIRKASGFVPADGV